MLQPLHMATSWQKLPPGCAQAGINFFVFATMAVTSFASGALVTTKGWELLNYGSLVPIGLTGLGLIWLALHERRNRGPAAA